MERHIKVARVHRALSWFYGLITLLLLVLLLTSGHESPPLGVVYILSLFGGIFALHHFTAKGARETKPWARKTSIGIALLMLLGFPLGTLIGVYLLRNTWGNWEKEPDIAESMA
jgi:hypothetical protein